MILQTIAPGAARDHIVELWRRAVLGDAAARQGLLQRITPRSAWPPPPSALPFPAPPARPSREAA